MLQTVPVTRVDRLCAEEFLREFKRPGRPVIISDLTRVWPARAKWSIDYLKHTAGGVKVPLYSSRPASGRRHQHAPDARMRLDQYLDRLACGENDLRIFFFNLFNKVPALAADFSYPEIGLKFFKKLPVLFVGGRGTRVQLHYDIDLADIILCHFGGPKRVYLFTRDQTPYLYRVPFSFSALHPIRVDQPDYARFPALAHARGQLARLQHGDALYIPPGCWHYVIYDDVGFSMSLRAFPRRPKDVLAMVWNLTALRSTEGVMRRLMGQRWNARNEQRAVQKTHQRLGISN